MQPQLIHISFCYDGPWGNDMANAFHDLASEIGKTPGLLWKVWTENRKAERAGGTYLFSSSQAAQAYLDVHLPRLSGFGVADIRMEQYDVNPALSTANRALPCNAGLH
jgi:hypothetical protein